MSKARRLSLETDLATDWIKQYAVSLPITPWSLTLWALVNGVDR
jgi:hypothetical protein